MPTRTTSSTITFNRPFYVSGIDGVHPAGTYVVEVDEELLEPLSFVAYRRIYTAIQLPPESGRSGCRETYVVASEALDAALVRDIAGG